MKILACLIALLVGGGAAAQVLEVRPPNPTSIDSITLRIAAPQTSMRLQPIVFDGSAIRVTFRGGSDIPSGQVHAVPLGRVAPGNYSVIVTYEITDGGDPETVISTVTLPPFLFQVAAAHFVPALEPTFLLALVGVMAFAAMFVLRR